MARFEPKVEARDLDDESKVYDAICQDNALEAVCFRSTGWSSEEKANERITEHLKEHASAVPMRELEAFRTGKTTDEYEEHVAGLQQLVDLPEEDGDK